MGIAFGDAFVHPGEHGGYSLVGACLFYLLVDIVVIVLFIILEFKYGRTPGKFICKTRVVDQATGAAITLRQSIIRNALRLVDGLGLYLVGFLIIALDKERQRLGDLIAKTVVIDERKLS